MDKENGNITENQQSDTAPPDTQKTDSERFDEILNGDEKLQSEFDKRLSEALEKAKSDLRQSIVDEQDEAKKLEKMTQAQRDAYNLEKNKAEFEKEKQAFKAQQMKVATGAELQKRGLDTAFADFLTASTAEQVNENISAFEKAFNQSVQRSINDKMRGTTPPREKEHKENSIEDAFLRGFTTKL